MVQDLASVSLGLVTDSSTMQAVTTSVPARWTSQRLWSVELLPADHPMQEDGKPVEIPTLKRADG